MEYRTLGRTGLKVSVIGFGGAPIGIANYLTHDDRDSDTFRAGAMSAVSSAIAGGINYFDTAPGYGGGRSELLFGEALEKSRDRIVLATKYSYKTGATRQQYTELLRQSLERLRTDCVDLLQLHGAVFSDELADEILSSGVLDWADEMRRTGMCRFTGITAEGPSGGLEMLLRSGRFDVLQIAYNLIYQSACDYQRAPTGVIPLARSLGMGVVTMRATTSGFMQKLLSQALGIADTAAVTRMAMNFVISTPEVDCALVGMRNAAEVAANISLAEDVAGRLDIKALHNRFD